MSERRSAPDQPRAGWRPRRARLFASSATSAGGARPAPRRRRGLRAVHRHVGDVDEASRHRSPCSGHETTPIDRPTGGSSGVATSSAAAACQALAQLRARAPRLLGASTQNSSPPIRAATSTDADRPAQRHRHLHQHAVAGLVAVRVVDPLEAVDVHEQQAERVPVALVQVEHVTDLALEVARRLPRPVSASVLACDSSSRERLRTSSSTTAAWIAPARRRAARPRRRSCSGSLSASSSRSARDQHRLERGTSRATSPRRGLAAAAQRSQRRGALGLLRR